MPSGLMSDINITLKGALKEAQACLDFASTDEREKERIKQAVAFGKNIGMASFVSGVIAFLPANYDDPDLNTKMDESRHLFAFADKVVDLDAGIMRPIKPSDYICLTTGYNAPTVSDPVIRADIQKVLYSIWEDKAVVEYVMKIIALQIHGRKRFEEFYVWTGRGGNGKGLLSEMIKRVFTEAKSAGDPGYFHTLPITCLTKAQDKTDQPNPGIALGKGKRFAQAQEPETDDKLRAGVIKELTGGDTIVARVLHQNPVSYVPQFGLFLQCNGVPKLNKLDGGIKRRMVVINFPFQFVESPSEPHHRPIDMDLKDKIIKSDAYRAEFMLMLLETFKTIGSTIEKPAFIKLHTDEYLEENDQIKEWLHQNYTLNKDPNDKRFKVRGEDMRAAFIAQTKTHPSEMTAQTFKTLMEMNGVVQKRESHAFDGFDWDEDEKIYVEAKKPAGSYYLGLERKA
jgi:P4 family phage/plasmid primase-like protien